MKTVGIVGSNSMVGSRFCELSKKFNLIKADLAGDIKVDITDYDSVANFVKHQKYDAIVLFSAFTDPDAAEKQKSNKDEICWKINVQGVDHFRRLLAGSVTKFILISTNFVFDGENGPYSEEDNPGKIEKLSWYGLTKLESEKITNSMQNSTIIRIATPYRAKFENKLDFARQILKRYDEGTMYPMFNDQLITPTFIDDIKLTLELVIEKDLKGIFHLTSPEITTPFDFAKFLLETFKKNTENLKAGSIKEFLKNSEATPKPIKSTLIVEKIINAGFKPTSWQEGIEIMYEQSYN